MRAIILLLFHIILCFNYGETNSLSLRHEIPINLKSLINRYSDRAVILANNYKISDVWNNIKNTAIKVWNFIKSLANNTKDKITAWIKNIKEKAANIAQELKKRSIMMKERLIEIIKNLFGYGEVVRKCIKKESEALEEIILEIVEEVSQCLAKNLQKLSVLDNYNTQLTLNDTKIVDIEIKLNSCLSEGYPEYQELCLEKVRVEIFEELDYLENDVLKRRAESRGVIDDILDAIISCSVESVLKASNAITHEALKIIKCILEG